MSNTKRRIMLGLGAALLVGLSGCTKNQENKEEVQQQRAFQKALKNYPDAKEFPIDALDQQFTIQIQDFFKANSGPYFIDARTRLYLADFDIERRDNGIFLSYWDYMLVGNVYRLRLRCSLDQISQVLAGDKIEGKQIIVFSVDKVRLADLELSAYSNDPEYGSAVIEFQKSTMLIIDGELVALLPIKDEGETP